VRVDPAIADLRRGRVPQLRMQAAMYAVRDAWRREARVAPVFKAFEAYAEGSSLAACAALAELFAEGGAAETFVASLCGAFAATLGREPFGQVPFRHAFDEGLSTLLLARSGTARLSLLAQEPGGYETASVLFSDAERHEAVIAGEARARLTIRRPEGALEHERQYLAKGRSVALDLAHETLFVESVERRLVRLRLHRDAPQAGPTREFSLADGRLVLQSSGDVRQSRQEMMLALLGRMKRTEAAPLIAEIAGEDGPDALRWQALRESLALDTASGFAALCRIARAPLDPLAAPAGILRAQLVEAHPELLVFEESLCRE
jgi:hypothetical protein